MTSSSATSGSIPRRRVLSTGLGLGGAAVLAACGGSTGDTSASTSTALKKDTGKITLLTWETYDDKPWLDAYRKSTGVDVEAITVGSGDEMFAKAQSGSVKVDVLYFDSGLIERFVRAKLIAPLKADRLKNTGNITNGLNWQKKNTYNGRLYAVPYNWGTQPLMYDADAIPTRPDSWAALWDPQYKGKVVLFDAADVTIPMVALYVGVKDPYNLSDQDFDEVSKALTALRPQVRTIAKGFDDAVNIFASGDGVIGYCQNISEVTALNKAGKNFGYAFPKEGTPQWLDNSIITPRGQRQEVYNFIDTTLTLPWQGRFVTSSTNNGILSAPEALKAKVPESVLKNTNIVDQQKPGFWESMSGLEAPESITRRLELWNQFKAGA